MSSDAPTGDLMLRTLAMPADTNPSGDIFGGWLLSQMDVGGSLLAVDHARSRVTTVAVESMKFHLPVYVGDVLCCYASLKRIGRTSITVDVQAWVLRGGAQRDRLLVTDGVFTYVAMDKQGRPRAVQAAETGTAG
ncbi:acyl-CoA thioesterase [Aquisalimonas sp.]|uniref:acyl-CoA thioesterase n=1 Tax=Aquisalimonas sp. TaxID=1872621 RepID=UPI0025BB1BEF|nr:acyl-CoA thioesterase [Aquisalimonas sp.]